MLKYFWQEKGSLENYACFEEIKPLLKKYKPEILKAWKKYKKSKKDLNNIMSNLSFD